MARFAATNTGKDKVGSLFVGPTAMVVGYGDAIEPARILAEYARTGKAVPGIKGGFLGARLLTLTDIKILPTLPSREVLIGKVLGGMQSPMVYLVNYLDSPIVGFTRLLQARIKQLEGN